MEIVLAALSEPGPAEQAATVSDPVLRGEPAHRGNRPASSPRDPRVLLIGLLAWTRVHGIISLEIEGFFEQVGVDPARLYETEIDHLVAQRTGQSRLVTGCNERPRRGSVKDPRHRAPCSATFG